MKVTVPHHTDRESAKGKVERILEDLSRRHAGLVTDLDQSWDGDRLLFAFKAKGLKASGTLEVTDQDVILNGKLPLMATPFEGKIKSAIQKEAESLFRKA